MQIKRKELIEKNYELVLKIIMFFGVFFVFLIYFWNAGFGKGGDDEIFQTAIQKYGSWYNWAKIFYYTNSGRVLIHTLLMVFLHLPVYVYRIVTPLIVSLVFLLLYNIVTVAVKKEKVKLRFVFFLFIFLGLFFSIPQLSHIIRWASCSLNYLYPTCAMLVVIYAFVLLANHKKIPIFWKIICVFSAFECGNMEQASAVVLAIGVLLFVYSIINRELLSLPKEKIFVLGIWIINLVIFFISYTAPGNQLRFANEILRCCGYEMFSLSQKLVLGVQVFVMYFFNIKSIIIWLLPSVLSIIILIKRRQFKQLILPISNILLCGLQFIIIRKWINLEFYYPHDFGYVLWLFFTVLLLFYNGFVIISILGTFKEKYLYGVFFLGAFASGVVPSLSPTIYASAERTMFISYVIMILINMKLFEKLLNSFSGSNTNEYKNNIQKIYAIVIASFSFALVGLFVFDCHKVETINLESYKRVNGIVDNCSLVNGGKKIKGELKVDKFAYISKFWDGTEVSGYDFDISIGIISNDTDNVKTYETTLNTIYAGMVTFPDGYVDFTGYLDYEMKPEETPVIICKNHFGDKFYQILKK